MPAMSECEVNSFAICEANRPESVPAMNISPVNLFNLFVLMKSSMISLILHTQLKSDRL